MFLAIYTDISPSVSHWVGVSRYIHWHFTISEPLGGCFSLYTLTFHHQWATGWGFLVIYTDISPSVSHCVDVSRYIHWHFTFSEPLGGCFLLYTLTFHLQWSLGGGFSLYTLTFHLYWVTGWVFFAIYTDISPSVSHWVDVSRYIHRHFTFSESLGGGFSVYTPTFHLQWATGWVFLVIYTDISPSVSHWVGVSHYIHWHFTFSEPLGGCFLLYTLTFHLQWATGWGFLTIYTDISPLVSHWVGVSRYIHWHFTFSESLGGGFSSPLVSHWVGLSRYIHWHFTFSEPLGGCFSLYIL